jgi:exopolysaccharide biosynthesis polyprenyl glycosylphosphotransferase
MTTHLGGEKLPGLPRVVTKSNQTGAVSDSQHSLSVPDVTTPGAAHPGLIESGRHGVVASPVSRWEPQYQLSVIISDLLVILGAVLLTVAYTSSGHVAAHASIAIAAATAVAMIAALAASRAWELRVLGQGAEEFRRLGRGVTGGGIVVGLTALALDVPNVRPWVFGAVPAVLLMAAPLRYLLRRVLHHHRRHDRCMLPVLAAGSVDEVADLIARTRREQHNGWRIEAVCTPGGLGEDGAGDVAGVPVVGTLDDLLERVMQGGYRVVAVVPDPRWTRSRLQQLAWQLESTLVDVVVAPVLMEVTGPRLHVSPVFGLPLLRVAAPRFVGFRWVIKSVVDRVAAAVGLLVIAPLLVGIAGAIWLHDRGPVFYRQARVGRDGTVFSMIKFRSMVIDAERRRGDLVTANEAAGPLFKMRRDPRITRIGAFLRRYSLDELPQLFNVLAGSMSLVGPRPPLPEEVAVYPADMRRRLKVKPGLTGLWQVSGRSDLSWSESVRLDVRYVENWSLALDLAILWKTFGAVRRGEGAY